MILFFFAIVTKMLPQQRVWLGQGLYYATVCRSL